jgi:hypothetical protein
MITAKHGSFDLGNVKKKNIEYGSSRKVWYNTGQVLPSLETGTPLY